MMAAPAKQQRSPTNAGHDGSTHQEDVEAWEDVPEKRLRFVDVLTELPNGDAAAATELRLQGRGFTEVESLESCRSLKKLELKDNYLADLGFLEMNHELCWLGMAKNRLERIHGLCNLASLAVLDLSDNRIVRLEGLAGLAGLKALIAARNRLARVEGLSPKKNPLLETLVLSHNRISDCNLAPFPMLKKISLAHNKLHAFPGFAVLPQLSELRLNGNSIPALLSSVSRQPRLSILDVGNNLLDNAEALEPLRGLLWMKSINLMGNPVANILDGSPAKGILASLSRLEILNNRRLPQAESKSAKNKGRRRHSKVKSELVTDARNEQERTPNAGASFTARHNGARRAGDKNVATVAKPFAIHGRNFKGRKSSFTDASDDEAIIPHAKDPVGSVGVKKVKSRKKRVLEEASPVDNGSDKVSNGVKIKKRKRKTCAEVDGVAMQPHHPVKQDGAAKPQRVKKRRKKV